MKVSVPGMPVTLLNMSKNDIYKMVSGDKMDVKMNIFQRLWETLRHLFWSDKQTEAYKLLFNFVNNQTGNINAYPDMFLNQNGVTFTKKVLEDLGYPAFVLCLLDAKARVFAIRSCKSNEPKGFKFSKPRGEQKGVVTISNKNLLDPLRAVTGEDWIPGKRYRVRGFWVADAKTMCFDLNEGVQEDFRPVTPNNDAE